jgi:hypothetical protein
MVSVPRIKWATLPPFAFVLNLTLLMSSPTVAMNPTQPIPQATAAARIQQRQEQLREIFPERYDLTRYPVTDANERYWRVQLWATAVVEPQETYVNTAIAQILALTLRANLSAPQKRTVDMAMQVGTQLYLSNPAVYGDLQLSFLQTIEQSQNPQWVAMSLSALVKGGVSVPDQQQWIKRIIQRIQQRFPQWENDVYLYPTLIEAASLNDPLKIPPLGELLQWQIVPNQLQIYALCRPDRGILCTTILKDPQGNFVQENGRLWSIPLWTRSLHGLAANFSRGQSPQGIYRIEGTIPQPDTDYFRAYGFFPLVQLFVPFEPGVKEFVPGRKGSLPNISAYQELLPRSWQTYFPIQQSYWAGRAGRSLFRIHGSGEAPTFFTNNYRYPDAQGWNPAIGCLSALELYDAAGMLQQSDMPKLLEALARMSGKSLTGYLIVVEVPSESKQPVSLTEIETAIANAR